MATIIQHKNTWYARWSVQGKRFEKTTGVKVKGDAAPARLKKLAQATADAMEAAAVGNSHVAAAMAAVAAAAESLGLSGAKCPTVAEFFESYAPSGGSQNVLNASRAITRFLAFDSTLRVRRLDAVTPSHCREWLRAESARVSGGTVRGYRAHVAAAFNRALRDELITRNPFAALRISEYAVRGDAPQKREPFTPEELGRMMREFPAPWCDMVLVSFLTGGQRLGDVACLEWAAVDFEAGAVRFHTSKTGAEIIAPMVPALRARLLALHERAMGAPEVFPEMAARYRRSNGALSIEFTALLRAAGIITQGAGASSKREGRRSVSAKSFHSIRHSVVTMLRTSNFVSPDLARAIVGHDSEAVERAYFTAPIDAKLAGLTHLANETGLG